MAKERRPEDDHGVVTRERPKTRRPKMYKVLLHNDDYTPMEFVVMVLETVFHKPNTEAVTIMLNVHKRGIGIAGVYPYEIAETKVHKVHALAAEQQHPLRSSLEENG
jgi:ATP-dependent Clp protease adaptor protein ClpS